MRSLPAISLRAPEAALKKAIAQIRYNVQIGTHLADIDRWIATGPRSQGTDDVPASIRSMPGATGR